MRTNNRDDFSEDTKRRAASRVGYRCSFPGCNRPTVGASFERNDKVSSIGEAAHICAAAPGGPRYDPNMTADERKGIDNCIWLCNVHARLIDTDESTYQAEEIRSWKNQAETAANQALRNGDLITGYCESNGDDTEGLSVILDSFVKDGRFDMLKSVLDHYKHRISDQYDELIDRYVIVYDVYCDRCSLTNDLEEYLRLPDNGGIDLIADLLVAFLLVDELTLIKGKCISETTETMVSLVLDHDLANRIIGQSSTVKEITIPADKIAICEKLLVYVATIKKLLVIKNAKGEIIKLYSGELYYKVISSLISAINRSVENSGDACDSEEFAYIEQNVDLIKQWDVSLQAYVWESVLKLALINPNKYEKLYALCPDVLKGTESIESLNYKYLIHNKDSKLIINEILEHCNKTGHYGLLIECLSLNETDFAETFLKDHAFLYGKDSKFIHFAQVVSGFLSKEDAVLLIERYREKYSQDFMYHCLVVFNDENNDDIETEYNWLRDNLNSACLHGMLFYIDLLSNVNRHLDMIHLSNVEMISFARYHLATRLVFADDNDCVEKGKEILQKLIESSVDYDHIHYYYGIACSTLSLYEEAKTHFALEYDLYENKQALFCLMDLRYKTNDTPEDKYLEACKHLIDYHAQNITGTFYYKNGDAGNAKKYFLRSLLIEYNKASLVGYFNSCDILHEVKPQKVSKNTAVTITNGEKVETIAIHPADIFEGIMPCTLAGCQHYSIDDPHITSLLFSTIGDTVTWQGGRCVVSAVDSVDSIICKAFFSALLDEPTTKQFHFSSAEQFMEDMANVLEPVANNIDHIMKEYDEMPIRMPLSMLATFVKRSMLETLLFLLHQDEMYINNNIKHLSPTDDKTYIMSFDSMVTLFELGIDCSSLTNAKIICPIQVRQQLLSEISAATNEWQSESHAATAFYDNGTRLIGYSPEIRRKNIDKLNRLKMFVHAIPVAAAAYDYSPKQRELKGVFTDKNSDCKMNCEMGTLGLCSHTSDNVLVSDDEFLYSIAAAEGISSVGITTFITMLGFDNDKLLELSKTLKQLRFRNYLPYTLYCCMIMNALVLDEPGKSIEKINQWLDVNEDRDTDEYHKDIVLALARDVYSINQDLLDKNRFLTQAAIEIIEERNPGFIEASIESFIKNLRVSAEQTDDGIVFRIGFGSD